MPCTMGVHVNGMHKHVRHPRWGSKTIARRLLERLQLDAQRLQVHKRLRQPRQLYEEDVQSVASSGLAVAGLEDQYNRQEEVGVLQAAMLGGLGIASGAL
eukprot:1160294-Pelagomonas_calceolata.AAC.10